MLLEIDDRYVDDFKALKGSLLCLNRFRSAGMKLYSDGVVITGASYYYFIKVHSKLIDDRHLLHMLVIERVEESELEEGLELIPLAEGELDEIHVFSKVLDARGISKAVVEEIDSDCALMLKFDGNMCLVFPYHHVHQSTGVETDLDKMLDIINEMGLKHSKNI